MWHSSEQNLSISKAHPRVTLKKLLEERTRDRTNSHLAPVLPGKKKKILAVVLARALLKLFGSPWLQSPWNAERIFFMHDLSTNEIIDIHHPYISCSLKPNNLDEANMVNFVFAFGILLLELEIDDSISTTIKDEEEADENCPPIYMALLRMFLLRKDDLDDYLVEVINSCLDFSRRVELINHPSLDDDLKPKAAIFRHIVQPLIRRLQAAHSEVSLEKLDGPQQPAKVNLPTTITRYNGQSSLKSLSQASTMTSFSDLASQNEWMGPPPDAQPRSQSQPRDRRDFEIAIICALPLEANAVQAVFDRSWDSNGNKYGKARGDRNAYSMGLIGRHNVVLAYMPGMGNNSATSVASDCRFSFENIKLALVIGICGGVPFSKQGDEILLGDVVISEGVVPYDFGRRYPDQFLRKDAPLDSLSRPKPEIRALLAKLKGTTNRIRLQDQMSEYLSLLQQHLGEEATYPGVREDKLFDKDYRHKHQTSSACVVCSDCKHQSDRVCEESVELTCEQLNCDDSRLVPRQRLSIRGAEVSTAGRSSIHQPVIHFGLVASGNTVMKSGTERDRIAANENVIAFEMEGAGAWDTFPCLIIKGICDYADSHKSKRWQKYAAATAAACAKAFLENWVTSDSRF